MPHPVRPMRRAWACTLAVVMLAACHQGGEAGPAMPSPTPAAATAPVAAAATPLSKDERMAWWRDARFGLFLHWGLYAVPAGEWKGRTDHGEWFMDETGMPVTEYERFAERFDPAGYDPDAWARAARDAGMRYIVITGKHHEGFSMWDTAASDYDIVERTPYGKDVLAPLAEAARRHGLRFGVYYSIMDWHHPAQSGTKPGRYNPTRIDPARKAEYVRDMKAQLRELVTRLDADVLWFDGEWVDWWTREDAEDLLAFLHALKPDIIVNNRIFNSRSGMAGISPVDAPGDFGTPEQEVPAGGLGPGRDWEACITMNDHWGYNRHDHDWKPDRELIRMLVDIASKGGNLLLNIGPTAEGELPAASLQRLAAIGRWMRVNGEAIHGTQAAPFDQAPAWGRVTRRSSKDGMPERLYLHVFDWPVDGVLRLPLRRAVAKARLLAAPGTPVAVEHGDGELRLRLPGAAPDTIASVIALDLAPEG